MQEYQYFKLIYFPNKQVFPPANDTNIKSFLSDNVQFS